jgi:hypothetical protein
MELKDIVRDYLIKNGFDGLFNQDNECGCLRDELMVCDEPSPFCAPGYKRKPRKDEDPDWDWVIDPNKSV